MQTKLLIEKLLALGCTKYWLAKKIGVTWHCVHAYSKGWYEAGFDNRFALERLIENIQEEKKQKELFDPVRVYNDDVINRWLDKKSYEKSEVVLDITKK